jgi:phage terminase large subunit
MELAFNSAYNNLRLTNKRYVCLVGGRGSAKSYTSAQDIVINMVEQDYFRCVIARANFSDIRGSQFQQIKDIINDGGMEHLFHIRENTMEIECKLNGNKIIAKGFRASSGSATAKMKSITEVN